MQQIVIDVNPDENGHQLIFKHSYEIKDALKARGYKYYSPLRMWYIHKATSEEIVEEIVALYEAKILTDPECIRWLVTFNYIKSDFTEEHCKRIYEAVRKDMEE